MASHRERPLDALRLQEDVAQRLLARAVELDAQSSLISVSQLRRAAVEAGISSGAFDAALYELEPDALDGPARAAAVRHTAAHEAGQAGRTRSRRWRGPLLGFAAAVLLMTGTVAGFAVLRVMPDAPMVVEVPAPSVEVEVEPRPGRTRVGAPEVEVITVPQVEARTAPARR